MKIVSLGGSPAHRAEWVNTAAPEFRLQPRVLHLLWAFALLPFSRQRLLLFLSCSTFPYFLFLPHFLQFTRTSLPKFYWACPLQVPPPAYFYSYPFSFPPMYFLSLLHLLIQYFPCLFRKIVLGMPAPGPSFNVLPSLSFYPSLPYFPVLWILHLLCLLCL